jgi:hypothetical protein
MIHFIGNGVPTRGEYLSKSDLILKASPLVLELVDSEEGEGNWTEGRIRGNSCLYFFADERKQILSAEGTIGK